MSDVIPLEECEFIEVQKVNGGKLIVSLLPDLAVVDCCRHRCTELAEYNLYVVAHDESNDISASVCKEHYQDMQRLRELAIPVVAIVN